MSWWRITSYFSEKPKDINALRHHQDHKLAEYYGEGNFWCTNSSKADGKPTLLISSKPSEVIRPEYVELAKPAVATEVLKGTPLTITTLRNRSECNGNTKTDSGAQIRPS